MQPLKYRVETYCNEDPGSNKHFDFQMLCMYRSIVYAVRCLVILFYAIYFAKISMYVFRHHV